MSEKNPVLVTGGSGFLGSHLVRRLLGMDANVICVDNFFSGPRSNVEDLIGNKRFELVRHDITQSIYLEVGKIYNLACPAAPYHYQRHPVHTTRTCTEGATNMLGLAKRTGAKMLQASTSEIYGNPDVHPQTEEYCGRVNPIGPRSCYDEGKRGAEALCFDYYRQDRVRIKVVRIFNTYGPRMVPHDGRVVSNFIIQALLGRDITIYGDGSQTRSFCYVDDLIDGLIAMMETGDEVTGPINLGNPNEMAVGDLAEMVVRLTKSNSRIVLSKAPQDDPSRRCPDITKAINTLGWKPKVPLEVGLERTIAYFRELEKKGELKDFVENKPI